MDGVGAMNEAGLSLMSFCVLNELCDEYEKKDIYKFSWQHPGTKIWHCIDHLLTRQGQRRRCHDVQVMRGAECFTDHRLLRAKIQIDSKVLGWKRASEPTSSNYLMLKNEDTHKALTLGWRSSWGRSGLRVGVRGEVGGFGDGD